MVCVSVFVFLHTQKRVELHGTSERELAFFWRKISALCMDTRSFKEYKCRQDECKDSNQKSQTAIENYRHPTDRGIMTKAIYSCKLMPINTSILVLGIHCDINIKYVVGIFIVKNITPIIPQLLRWGLCLESG